MNDANNKITRGYQHLYEMLEGKADKAIVIRFYFLVASAVVLIFGGWWAGQIHDDNKRERIENAIIDNAIQIGRLEERIIANKEAGEAADQKLYQIYKKWIPKADVKTEFRGK